MKNVIVERVIHKGVNRVALRFPYDTGLISVVKGFPDARWSQQMGCWHIADSTDVITLLEKTFYGKAYIDYSALKPNLAEKIRSKREEEQRQKDEKLRGNIDADLAPLSDKGKADLEKYRRWMESHRYPETTIRTYTGMVTTYLRFISPKEASECTSGDLIRLVDEYILPEGLSYSYQNQMVSAVKKFYGKIYRSVIDPGDFTRPRPQHRLPNVLSKEEVKRVLDAPVNEKHRVMLSLIYACGLRRSELIELVPGDLERDRKLLRIRQSKGFKDRVVPISEKVIQMIDLYITHFRPEKYLFEGQYRGDRYSASSLDKVFKEAVKRAGLRREVTLHGLRHSYATHLLESGTDLRYIQELLGHKSSRTTEIYTHVTTKSIQKIRSPFDDL
jgi:integrase/recombinase XerD